MVKGYLNDKSPAWPSFCFEPISPTSTTLSTSLQERFGSCPSNFYTASADYGGVYLLYHRSHVPRMAERAYRHSEFRVRQSQLASG